MTTLSIRPKILDIDLYAGDTFTVLFRFIDEDTGLPWPLVGTWAAQIRNRTSVVEDFTVDDSDAADGELHLSLTGEQTATIGEQPGCQHGSHASTCGNCLVWDLEQTYPGGVRTWYYGTVSAMTDVTRLVP